MARAPHFLHPLLTAAPAGFCLRNQRTGRVIADRLLPALDSSSRKTGLLKHDSLADGEAMIIAPSNAVHTWFMRFDIDILFVRRDGRVVKTRAGVRPWRMSGALRGFAVIEMRSGTLAERDAQPGDQLELVQYVAAGL
jgi:uncharacterized membrane protein (UPF0127 family)